jgi:methylated-DNA-[protein]-cysteine S-methyltransferase
VRARFTQYAVPGWGVGELWTGDDLVLAHEFRFQPVSDTGVAVEADVSRAERSGRVGVAMSSEAPTAAMHAYERIDCDHTCGANGAHSARLAIDGNQCLTPDSLVDRFLAFFAGEDADLDDVPIDLSWATPFQRDVATALRAVPRGEVVSYGELAALAGYPGAARAAGTFCAHNRFMLILPCHRVVGASGIGGYGAAGGTTKRRLLALEGVDV